MIKTVLGATDAVPRVPSSLGSTAKVVARPLGILVVPSAVMEHEEASMRVAMTATP